MAQRGKIDINGLKAQAPLPENSPAADSTAPARSRCRAAPKRNAKMPSM